MSGFGPTIRQLGQSKTQRARQAQVGREGDMVNRKKDNQRNKKLITPEQLGTGKNNKGQEQLEDGK